VTVIHLNAGQLQDERQIRADTVRDVAVIRLGTLTSDGMNTTPGVVVSARSKGGIIVAPFEYLTRYTAVDISSQIFMLGYPAIGVSGAAQIDRTRPLVRSGIVAGVNAAMKTIIIDAPVNHGNSGGPSCSVANQQTPHHWHCHAVRSCTGRRLAIESRQRVRSGRIVVAHAARARQLGLRGGRVRGRHHRSHRELLARVLAERSGYSEEIRKGRLRARARPADALRSPQTPYCQMSPRLRFQTTFTGTEMWPERVKRNESGTFRSDSTSSRTPP
jgi:hypothetical protein